MSASSGKTQLEIDWSLVDPATASSLQMALEMGLELDGLTAAEWAQKDEESAAQAQQADAMYHELSTEFQEVENTFAEATNATIDDDDDNEEEEEDEEEEPESPCSTAVDKGNEDDGQEPEEEGMGYRRETTKEFESTEDEWIPVEIKKRRLATSEEMREIRQQDGDDCAGEDFDERDAVGFAPRASAHRGAAATVAREMLYLVVWKGYERDEPTWERGAWLEELGFRQMVDAFNQQKAPQVSTSKRKLRPKKPAAQRDVDRAKRIHEAAMRRFRRQLKGGCNSVWLTLVEQLSDAVFAARDSRQSDLKDIDSIVAERGHPKLVRLLAHLLAKVRSCGRHIQSITPVMPAGAMVRTSQLARAKPDATRWLVFHGTRQEAVAPISSMGLVVPGHSGVKVVNGSAYGIGIYTAKNCPSISFSYAGNDGYMFVGLGLNVNDSNHKVRDNGSVAIFFHEDLVCPLFVMKTAQTTQYGTKPQTLMDLIAGMKLGDLAKDKSAKKKDDGGEAIEETAATPAHDA